MINKIILKHTQYKFNKKIFLLKYLVCAERFKNIKILYMIILSIIIHYLNKCIHNYITLK